MASQKKRRRGGAVPAAPVAAPQPGDLTRDEALSLTYQMAGAAQAFRFTAASSRVHELLVIKQIREHGTYEAIGQTWESFCAQVLGRPRSSVDEELQNLEVFGEEVMEVADQLSLSRAALRGLRRLPREVRPKVLDGELEVGDQRIPLDGAHMDQVAEIIEGILAEQERMRHHQEAGDQEIEQLKKDREALRRRLDEMDNPPDLPDGITQHDRRWMDLLSTLVQIVDDIKRGEEGTEAARVKPYYQIAEEHMRDVLEHWSGYRRAEQLPEGYDPALAEEVAREMED